MSNYLDLAKRQETLKGLIMDLHAGKSVSDVKAAFADLIQDIGPSEIAEMEQNLIAEGLPEMEVKRLCDVHVEVFRESLDAHSETRPETVPGHPVHTFLAENEATGPVLEALEQALASFKAKPNAGTLTGARQALKRLREYEKHYLRKENILFPYLEKHQFSGPSAVMWAIHDDVRADWKSLDALLANAEPAGGSFDPQIDELFARLKIAISEMFYKEENILFTTAMQKLSQQEWAEIREQEADIGYCYVQPGDSWLPVVTVASDAGELLSTPAGKLQLNTGSLTPEQVNLLLDHLPVEVTFVDENDEVRYFSQSKDVIFPRSPAIIGRKVQNCHPPQTVDRVQQIVDDFRAGRRDVAEFWIHMQGKHIYIRYFAIRDEKGEYRGAMEVTQEISRIQELKGERRLLDEGE